MTRTIIPVDKEAVLRRLKAGDAKDIFRTIDSQREYLGKWLPFVHFTHSVEDSEAFVQSVLAVPEENMEYVFALMVGGEFAGLFGVKDTDRVNLRTEIGYWMSEPFQGRGIATRATKALCDLAFKDMEMNRVQIKCAVGNTPSSNIPKRLGFKFEGIERAGERTFEGGFFDIEVYSLLRSEYLME